MSSLVTLFLSALALATFTPTAPGPGDSFTAGSPCTIKWNADTTGGKWTDVSIYLMTGSNNNMTRLTTVVSGLDGTDESFSPYSWTCPEVDPYSVIYFYQFTNGDDVQNSQWTTRFTITSASGDSEKPEYDTQPNGDPVPWGEGRLVSGAKAAVHHQALSGVGSQRDRSDNALDDGSGSGSGNDEPESGGDDSSTDDLQNGTYQHEDDGSSDEPGSSFDSLSSDTASTSSRHATGSPTASGGVSRVLIPTVSLPAKVRPAQAQPASLSTSATKSSASCSRMGPGISNANNAVKLTSAGCTREDRRWQGAASLYWFLAAMLL